MPINCSVYGCSATSEKCAGLSFHAFPKDNALLKTWMVKLRHGKTPSKWARVCSRHFEDKDYITPLNQDELNKYRHLKPNAFPTQNLPVSSIPSRIPSTDRGRRLSNRKAKFVASSSEDTQTSQAQTLESDDRRNNDVTSESERHDATNVDDADRCANPPSSNHVCSHSVKRRNNQLYGVCLLNEKQMLHNTGFIRKQFDCLWHFCVSREGFKPCRLSHVNSQDQLLLTLMKLRRNMSYQTLGDNFGISEKFASNIFGHWIEALYIALREVDFRNLYEKVEGEYDIVIDCTEIPIQCSCSPDIAQATYSNYKGRLTFKALVGVSESGASLYCSDLFGGAISDRQIVQKSDFLDHLKDGDFVLADKGFLIADLLEEKGATLNIPPFRESRHVQMTPLQVATTRAIGNRRIVVEQVIGKTKNYNILCDVMPSYLWRLANKIFYVTFFLGNFKGKAV